MDNEKRERLLTAALAIAILSSAAALYLPLTPSIILHGRGVTSSLLGQSGTGEVIDDPPLALSILANPPSGLAPLQVNFASSVGGGASGYSYSWNFGDGATSSAGTTSHTFTKAGTYTTSLTVTDPSGDVGTNSVVISVSNQPLLAVSILPTAASVTPPFSESFTANTVGGASPYQYSWSYGDGTSGSGGTASHVYSQAGTFNVQVTVTDSAGKTASDRKSIYVSNSVPLAVSVLANPPSATPGTSIQLTSSVTGGTPPYSYSWNFGDGSTGTGGTTSHVYGSQGTFPVVLTVTDAAGNVASRSQAVGVSATVPLEATLSTNNPSGVAPLGVHFILLLSGGSQSFSGTSWDYGDGSTDSGNCCGYPLQVTHDHTYTRAGSFTVTVTGTDNKGNTMTVSATVTTIGVPLAMSLSANNPSGVAPLAVHFTGIMSGGNQGANGFSWDYGDGTKDSDGGCCGYPLQHTRDHTFSAPGNYTVTLTGTDNSGRSVSVSMTIDVIEVPLALSLFASPPFGGEPLQVSFTGILSGGVPGYQSFSWNFGDGTTAGSGGCGNSPCQTGQGNRYNSPGNYTVSLTGTDSAHQSVTSTAYVVVTVPTVTSVISTTTSTVSVVSTRTATTTIVTQLSTVTSTTTFYTTQFATAAGTSIVTLSTSNSLSPVANTTVLSAMGVFALIFVALALAWRKRP